MHLDDAAAYRINREAILIPFTVERNINDRISYESRGMKKNVNYRDDGEGGELRTVSEVVRVGRPTCWGANQYSDPDSIKLFTGSECHGQWIHGAWG